jgi:hypothetical protein
MKSLLVALLEVETTLPFEELENQFEVSLITAKISKKTSFHFLFSSKVFEIR